MLVIVNTLTGAKVCDLAAGDAILPGGLIILAPQAGMRRGDERIVECVEVVTGEGPLAEITDENYDGEHWVIHKTLSTPSATIYDVRAECRRRLAAGFDYDFGDERGVHTIGTTERDMAGWDEVTMLAQAMLNAGNTEGTIAIATDSGVCEVTAMEWNAILLAAAAFRQPIWQASFLLQAMDPVPADYADDSYWPTPA